MIAENTTTESLENQAALASRLIRTKPILQIYFRWLTTPNSKKLPPQTPAPGVQKSIDALLAPLRHDADKNTQKETETASQWIASLCQYVAARQRSSKNGFLTQTLAASLLPLYRSLATGRLQEGLSQTIHRFAETLVLIGLDEMLQLRTLLDLHVNSKNSPYYVLGKHLKLDLLGIYYLISQTLGHYNQAEDCFHPEARTQLWNFKAAKRLPTHFQTPEWSCPQLLWVLSNEIVSSRSELILPRSWIDTPVPWNKISGHWNELSAVLAKLEGLPDNVVKDASPVPLPVPQPERHKVQPPRPQSVIALENVEAIIKAVQNPAHFDSMDIIDQVLEQEYSRSSSPSIQSNGSEQTKLHGATANTRREATVIPKVIIGEITNHNDTALANVVRRQIGICRTEDRSICLSIIVVTADDQKEHSSLASQQDNGLSRWQQKLVNWISDHPDFKQPIAFVTRDGQLILIVMDTERNTMTRVLKEGMAEVLTDKSSQQQGDDLSKVAIPARYHVGMSSTSAPGASFESSELIASANRCLSAAQRLGSASIKSIEVF